MFTKIGEELKQARENLGMSLSSLEYKTKIDIKILMQFETGDFSALDEVYLKAFLKKYAKTVKLDENLIVKKYLAAKEGISIEEFESRTIVLAEPIVVENKNLPSKVFSYEGYEHGGETADNRVNLIKKYRFYILGVFLVIVVALLITVFLVRKIPNEIIRESSFEEVIKDTKQKRYTEPEKTGSDTLVRKDSLSLKFSAVDTSWIMVVKDSRDTLQFTLFPMQNKELRGKSRFSVWIGNSLGIELSLNNRSLEFNKGLRMPQRLVIEKDGIKESDL